MVIHSENRLLTAPAFIGDILEFRIGVPNAEQCQQESEKSFQIWRTHLKA
jgi:hypothetical protein